MMIAAAALCAGAVLLWWIPAPLARLQALSPSPREESRVRQYWDAARGWILERTTRASADREVRVLRALAAELRTGQPPDRALRAAQSEIVVWPHAARAAEWGSHVAEALAQECPSLAACWQVNSRTGAPMVPMVERLVESKTDDAKTRTALAAALAGPRATARMLALLPIIGIALGSLLGTQPLAWLLGPGIPAFIAGGVLAGAGALWTHRITAGVERQL